MSRGVHHPGVERLVCLPRTTEVTPPVTFTLKIRQGNRFLRPPASFFALEYGAEPAAALCSDEAEVLEDCAGTFMADPDCGNSDADDGKELAVAENT